MMSRDFDLSLFKMGYILAYRGDSSWFSKQIIKVQERLGFPFVASRITHVEVSGGEEYSVNIVVPISRCIKITERHAGRYVHVMRYKNEEYERKGRYKVAYFSATLSNLRYDVLGVVRFLVRWVRQSNKLWFCSEGVAWALQKEYPESLGGTKPVNCLPANFLDEKEFEEVWQGRIPG